MSMMLKESFRCPRSARGRLPKTVKVLTSRGFHLYYRLPDGIVVGNRKLAPGLDLKGDGGYVVGPGSVHPTGALYKLQDGRRIYDREFALAPDWLIELAAKPATQPRQPQRAQGHVSQPYADAVLKGEVSKVKAARAGERNETLNRAAFRLAQVGTDKAVAVSSLLQAAVGLGLSSDEASRTIESGWQGGTLNPRSLAETKRPEAKGTEHLEPLAADDLACELALLGETDADNGQRFARRYADKAVYTPGRGLLFYDGTRWRPDDLRRGYALAESTARMIAAEASYLQGEQPRASRARFAQASLSKGSLERMLELAKSHLAIEDNQLDADPWLLNVQNGTLDLRMGKLRRHDPHDRITKLSPVVADPAAKCPVFKRVVSRALKGDKDLIRYFQRAVGSTLAGDISDQVFFFLHGPSKTAKSTLLNSLREMLGDFGVHTPTETLLTKQYDNAIPVDLARLAGARMVTAIEANWNRQLDEARIKGMTGGEPIVARFMRQNLFSFQPEFTLWLAANDFPRVRGTSGAFWERVRVIPFTVQIPPEERDKGLPAKLRAEWPGILAWAVRGCLKWQREGLQSPQAVKSGTNLWKEGADHLKRFVDESLVYDSEGDVQASALYRHYLAWCTRHGETPLSIQIIKARLPEFDLVHKRIQGRSIWKGVKLRI
jgi:putative DNA primase/helicase